MGILALGASHGSNELYEAITGDEPNSTRAHWDTLYRAKAYVYGREPEPILKEKLALLKKGRALDIAMGEGRNGVYLATQGFEVEGVDISEVALRKAQRLARERGVRIRTRVADLGQFELKSGSYDTILVIHYVQTSLAPRIERALKRGGTLLYVAPISAESAGHPVQKSQLAARGDLKRWFSGLETLYFSSVTEGQHPVEILIARKR
jgi:2-polyprenyl-3-methyl-5-hydroxy-6-metoxy-1,4-benzoquinol methylase